MPESGARNVLANWSLFDLRLYHLMDAESEISMRLDRPYTRFRDGAWYVGETGITAFSIVAMWQQGFSPEEIQTSFPALSLREIYGTILHYLEHRDEMDAFFREQDALFRAHKAESEARNPTFYDEMRQRIARFRTTHYANSATPIR